MIKEDIIIEKSRVLILGITFKENCPDIRNTKIIDIIEELNCNYPVYLGDTRDDLELVKNYRLQTGKKMDFCLIESPYNISGYDLKMPSAEYMLKTMERKNEYYQS